MNSSNKASIKASKTDTIEHESITKEEDEFEDADFYDDDAAFADYDDGDFSDFQESQDAPAFCDYDPSDLNECDYTYDDCKMRQLQNPSKSPSKTTVALSPQAIQQHINKKVNALSEQLDLEQAHSLLLLRRHSWNSTKILELYFNEEYDTKQMLIDAGICIHRKPKQQTQQSIIECNICLNHVHINDTFCIDCGHDSVCKSCWIDYIRDAVKTKHCINLSCPQYKCHVIIDRSIWKTLISDAYPQEFERYLRFCEAHFIEHNKEFIFCGGRGCEMIYRSEIGVAREICCVSCSYCFCSKCENKAHFPASCHIATKWIKKSSSESENIAWILAKTKKCPKCRIYIEKNQGCNHMTCRPNVGGCGHEFCWLCKGDWSEHNSSTGGYYKCNIYAKNKEKGIVDNEEKAQHDAANELERYEFHYTRFDSHYKSYQHAIKQREMIQMKMHELAEKFKWRLNETQFLGDSVDEVKECWRVLAWTYSVAYYSSEITQAEDEISFNLELFSEQQRKLEEFCDGLQEKLDFDLGKLGEIKVRQSVINFTKAAKKYRNNMVSYIESVLF